MGYMYSSGHLEQLEVKLFSECKCDLIVTRTRSIETKFAVEYNERTKEGHYRIVDTSSLVIVNNYKHLFMYCFPICVPIFHVCAG